MDRLAPFVLVAATTSAWLVTVLGILTIGVLVLPVAMLLTVVLAAAVARERVPRCAWGGVVTGLGILPGWFTYLAAGHPGLDAVSGESLPPAPVLGTATLLVLGCGLAIALRADAA